MHTYLVAACMHVCVHIIMLKRIYTSKVELLCSCVDHEGAECDMHN